MKVRVKAPILSLQGQEIQEEVIKERDANGNPSKVVRESVTIGKLIINALMGSYRDDDQCTGEEKIRRFSISSKIQESADDVELNIEDISLIKNYVNKAGYNPLAYTRIHEALEGKEVGETAENGN